MSCFIFELHNFDPETQFKSEGDSITWGTDQSSVKYIISDSTVEIIEEGTPVLTFYATWVVPDGKLQLNFINDEPEQNFQLNSDNLTFTMSCNGDEHLNGKQDEKTTERNQNKGDAEYQPQEVVA